MNKIRINIDGKEIYAAPGTTILQAAKDNGIVIPTLCYDERTEIYGSCGLCVCEIEGSPKLVKACATEIAPNMIVNTKSERVIESRKVNLELLLSNHTGDCRPPCVLACPAGTDCQGYVGLIANGKYEDALELIKDVIPLPASIGRVCPHPCETKCRRGLIDEPISLQQLKRFAADMDMYRGGYVPDTADFTGKSVAVVGGGPMGLSCAYFLAQKGHEVTVFEAMPNAGGMLRYGIPEYRLPKDVLEAEVALIESMGVTISYNTKVGKDISFDTLRKNYDAVVLGIGAWLSTGVGCKGEDAEGVIGGIDFLRKVERDEEIKIGRRVAIVGGGNTAMDACRTAVRMGAQEVYNIYRRTKDEMPADREEIAEAEEEGVIFKNLTNPLEVIKDENGRIKQVVLQVMKLGEPDASGRRSPVAIEGKTETLTVDTLIQAIGQAVDSEAFELDKTRKKGIAYDKETFMTSLPGVFAGGDCGNDKISIAVEAIADAKKVAASVDGYLRGVSIKYEKPYYVERDDIDEKTFEDRERACRPEREILSPEDRRAGFSEVSAGFDPVEAREEAQRCLECGCHDYFECKLVKYANEYKVQPDRFEGEKNSIVFEDNHPFIVRDPNKCILCGLCVRVCDEVMGIGALGLVSRGFDTVVKPALELPLAETNCISCGQCVSVCPTGALQEKLDLEKEVPLDTCAVATTCSFCSVGCSLEIEKYGDMLVKSNPDKCGKVNAGLICARGKWGFDAYTKGDILAQPYVKKEGRLTETEYREALETTAKKMQRVKAKCGEGSTAIAVSDRYTNEEAYAIKKCAEAMGAKIFCFNNRQSGLKPVLGADASPNTIDELISTELIIAVGFEAEYNPIIRVKLRQAVSNGAKAVFVNTEDCEEALPFGENINVKNDLSFLKEFAKAICETKADCKTAGYEEFVSSLSGVKPSDEASCLAKEYLSAKKAMIVYQQNILTTQAATLLADAALISGHIGSPRDGILQIKSKNNSQGLIDLGITAGAEALEGVKGLIIFGEDVPEADLSALEFLAVSDTNITETAKKADVLLPASAYASTDGTYTNTERRMQQVNEIVSDPYILQNWELAAELIDRLEHSRAFDSLCDISREAEAEFASYRNAEIGEIYGGVLKPQNASAVCVKDGKLTDKLVCTDSLMNRIDAVIPKPAE